jgi:hypothetical protein
MKLNENRSQFRPIFLPVVPANSRFARPWEFAPRPLLRAAVGEPIGRETALIDEFPDYFPVEPGIAGFARKVGCPGARRA